MLRLALLLGVAAAASACGISEVPPNDASSLIVGGKEAVPHSWPWMVEVLKDGWGHYCGGTLIDNQWVVSAAHCFSGPDKKYQFSVGGHRRADLSEPTRKTFQAAGIFKHESYGKPESNSNDIVLIKLTEPVTYDSYVQPACLPAAEPDAGPSDGETVAVIGWGALESGGGSPDMLQDVYVPIVSLDRCREAYGSSVDETMICAGLQAGGKDSCQGDSGGPLVRNVNNAWVLDGVVSWGYGCAEPNYPGVYANVHHLRSWIVDTMAAN